MIDPVGMHEPKQPRRDYVATTWRQQVNGHTPTACHQALALAAVTLPDNATRTHEPVDGPTDPISTLQPETPREVQDRMASDNPRGLLAPGTYVVDVDGLRPAPVVDLPEGFRFQTGPEMARFEGWGKPDCTVPARACPPDSGGRLKVGFWNGEQIRVHPELCGRFEDFKRPGPSVDDLATALADLPG